MPEMIPQGNHRARVVSATYGATKKEGTPFIKVGCELLDGELQNLLVDAYVYLSDKAFDRATEIFQFLGFNNDLDAPAFSGENAEAFEITCKHEEYNGRWSEKWSIWPPAKPPSADITANLAAKLRATGGAPPPRPSTPPPARTTPAATPPATTTPPRPTTPARPAAPARKPFTLTGECLDDVKNVSSMDECWQYYERYFDPAAHNGQPPAAVMYARIDAAGKTEAQFTQADWVKVAEFATLPF